MIALWLRLWKTPSPLRSGRRVDLDFPLLAGCLALLGLGLVMITSASSEVAAASPSQNVLQYMTRQLVYLLLGLGAGMLTLLVPLAAWQRWSGWLLFAAFLLLVLVLVPGIGREVNGARRWISLGPANLQPSELAKLFVIFYLAAYMVRRQQELQRSIMGFIKPMVVACGLGLFLLLEPDFGATVVLVCSCITVLFLGGINLWRFVPLAGGVLALGVLVMTAQQYRLARLSNFIDPWADQFGAGYQLSQALIAFGRGEWFGVGLGNSVQKQFYLPEAHTDFVFAVLAEELGMVGALLTVALFVFVTVRALYIGLWADRMQQHFSAYVAYGIGIQWVGQMLINVGVNLGLLPTKGLTLPFLSYGGSSLIVCCIGTALLLRIDWERRRVLGFAEVQFSEDDFRDPDASGVEVKHGR